MPIPSPWLALNATLRDMNDIFDHYLQEMQAAIDAAEAALVTTTKVCDTLHDSDANSEHLHRANLNLEVHLDEPAKQIVRTDHHAVGTLADIRACLERQQFDTNLALALAYRLGVTHGRKHFTDP